jgi:hypothetical protein
MTRAAHLLFRRGHRGIDAKQLDVFTVLLVDEYAPIVQVNRLVVGAGFVLTAGVPGGRPLRAQATPYR